ncbi:MAG: nitrite/sulfite reductase [Thermaerobacter sp.]|nr:nitrite/sulfite reductase [Thermaerobacter sp.]
MSHDNPQSGLAFTPGEALIKRPAAAYRDAWFRYQSGSWDGARFRTARIEAGIHLQRAPSTRYMVRVKVPYGWLSSQQLRTLADLAPAHTPTLHFTTRQAVELHDVEPEATVPLLAELADAGLTTWEAGGNSVRNVAGCPLLGTCAAQVFDPVPVMRRLVRSLLDYAPTKNLPRKLKLAVSGCDRDCSAVRLQDVGVVATRRDGDRGFRVYVGGGIGATPALGELIAAFVPVSALIALVQAIAEVFNQRGNRTQRHRARLKWLVKEMGLEDFQHAVVAAYQDRSRVPVIWAPVDPIAAVLPAPVPLPLPPPCGLNPAVTTRRLWAESGERWAVALTWPGGILHRDRARQVALWADQFGNGRLSTTTWQQLMVHGVPAQVLPELIAEIKAADPEQFQTATTVISCPGAPYCNLAVTRSSALAKTVAGMLQQAPSGGWAPNTVQICGCPHSCTHVRFAELGVMGGAARLGRILVPVYTLWLGGQEQGETPQAGSPTVRIPARRVPEVIRRLLEAYAQEGSATESFGVWARRRFLLTRRTGGEQT